MVELLPGHACRLPSRSGAARLDRTKEGPRYLRRLSTPDGSWFACDIMDVAD